MTQDAQFEQFFDFLAVKLCLDLKSKQGGFFRLGLAVQTKKKRRKKSHPVKSYSNLTA